MSLLFCDSFDHYTTPSQKWSVGSTPAIGAFGRNSTNGLRLTGNSQAVSHIVGSFATLIVGCAIKVSAYPTSADVLLAFLDGATSQCQLELTPSGTLQITRPGTILAGPGGTVLSAGSFYYIEFKATINDITGTATVRINGVQELTVSNVDTKASANATADTVYMGGGAASAWGTKTRDYDDLYVCNTAGTTNNAFLGDVSVQCILPDGAGGNTSWTPSAGSNYQNVDETTPNDDTDYNSSSTVGQRDTYTMSGLTATTGSVLGIQMIPYVRKDDAGTRTVAPVLRIGGVNYDQANLPNLSTSYQYLPLVLETSPATSSAFTIAEVNGLEAGIKMVA